MNKQGPVLYSGVVVEWYTTAPQIKARIQERLGDSIRVGVFQSTKGSVVYHITVEVTAEHAVALELITDQVWQDIILPAAKS